MQIENTERQLPDPQPFTPAEIWRLPLPELKRVTDRLLTRAFCTLALHQVRSLEGWAAILPDRDPFLLVANHSSRREAVYLPALLLLLRGGLPVHFLADWNFRLVPGVGRLYKGSGAITVTRKEARPRILNGLKQFFADQVPPREQAARALLAGRSVGLFPEGSVNRRSGALLRGRFGAARLSLETRVPVLPVGIRFDRSNPRGETIDSSSAMSIRIGSPMPAPIGAEAPAPLGLVRDWHARLMGEIGCLSAKVWPPMRPDPEGVRLPSHLLPRLTEEIQHVPTHHSGACRVP
jgi:1-acyl-sn-glycerol-3-phosphate acyltransferase